MALSDAQCAAYAGNGNDILKIISNLPCGWKVVGLTEMNQDKEAPSMPKFFPQNVEQRGIERPSSTTFCKGDACPSFPITVNNVHDPQLSVKKVSSSNVNKDNSNELITVGPLGISNFNPGKKDGATSLCLDKKKLQGGDQVSNSMDLNATLGKDHSPIELNKEENISASQEITSQSYQFSEKNIHSASENAEDILQSFRSDSKWTVVGITPLPQLPDTEVKAAPVGSSSSNMSPLLSTEENRPNDLHHQNQTILKIPYPSFHNASQPSTPKQDKTITNIIQPTSEEMRWTIVGFTNSISSTTNKLLMAVPNSHTVTTTSSPSVVNQAEVSSSKLAESRSVDSLHVPSPLHHPEMIGQPSIVSKPVEFLNNSNPLFSNFSSLNSIISPEIQSQVPSQWKVVGISPIVNPANPRMNLPQYLSHQSLQLPTSSLTSTSCLKETYTTSTSATISSVAQVQNPSPISQNRKEVSKTEGKLPTSVRSPFWQGHVMNNLPNPDVLPLTLSTAVAYEKYDRKGGFPYLSKDCQTKLSSMLQAKMNNKDYSPLKEAQSNEWKVVGVVANNQVSMLPPETAQEDKSPAKNSEGFVPISTPSLFSSKDAFNVQHNMELSQSGHDRIYPHIAIGTKEQINISDASLQPLRKHETHIDKRKQELDWNRRAKDMLKKSNTSKLKKNTVSSLLKMKRYQVIDHEHSNIDTSQNFCEEDLERFTKNIPRKRCRSRSLRSYSGSRQHFQTLQDRLESTYPVKSSSDTTFSDLNSEEESEKYQTIKMEKFSPPASPVDSPERSVEEVSNHSFSHSPARRRKLKVPRKMVADVDYHPFDSSSDSN